MRTDSLSIPQPELAAICQRFAITEMSLFGSALREDFGPESDIDVLIEFESGKTLDLDMYIEIRDVLSQLFDGREVDLVEKRRLVDPYRRHEILRTREIIYAH